MIDMKYGAIAAATIAGVGLNLPGATVTDEVHISKGDKIKPGKPDKAHLAALLGDRIWAQKSVYVPPEPIDTSAQAEAKRERKKIKRSRDRDRLR